MKITIYIALLYFFVTTTTFASESLHPGITVDQLITLKGQPYYQTEHYSHRKGEQVWLYTEKKETKTVEQKQIIDPTNQWPTLYRKTVTRTCDVGVVFVEVSQGIVKSVIPANTTMPYGPCVIGTIEEFLPIVDGKPAETPARKNSNTVLE